MSAICVTWSVYQIAGRQDSSLTTDMHTTANTYLSPTQLLPNSHRGHPLGCVVKLPSTSRSSPHWPPWPEVGRSLVAWTTQPGDTWGAVLGHSLGRVGMSSYNIGLATPRSVSCPWQAELITTTACTSRLKRTDWCFVNTANSPPIHRPTRSVGSLLRPELSFNFLLPDRSSCTDSTALPYLK